MNTDVIYNARTASHRRPATHLSAAGLRVQEWINDARPPIMFHKIFRTIHHPPPRVIIAPNGAAFRFGGGGSGRGFSGSRENQLPPSFAAWNVNCRETRPIIKGWSSFGKRDIYLIIENEFWLNIASNGMKKNRRIFIKLNVDVKNSISFNLSFCTRRVVQTKK